MCMNRHNIFFVLGTPVVNITITYTLYLSLIGKYHIQVYISFISLFNSNCFVVSSAVNLAKCESDSTTTVGTVLTASNNPFQHDQSSAIFNFNYVLGDIRQDDSR